MGLKVRDADLKDDREEFVQFLNENLTESRNESRFDWLYFDNPHGLGRAWIATDDADHVIGIAAAFPRTFRVAGHPRQGWVLGDFCIDKNHRTLGPAVALQRVVLESLTKGENNNDAICYDFPSSGMLSIYRRLGVPVLGEHVRYAKLLSTADKVQQVFGRGFIGQNLSRVGDLALRFQQLLQTLPADIEFSVHEGLFDDEFTELGRNPRRLHPIEGLRDADYLNWRYKRHPQRRYCVVVGKRKAALSGYAVIEIAGHDATVADVQTTEPEDVLPGLLAYMEIVLRKKQVHSINFPVLQGCHLNRYLPRAGFYPRETAPVIAFTGGTRALPDIQEAKNWLLLSGDRES